MPNNWKNFPLKKSGLFALESATTVIKRYNIITIRLEYTSAIN